MVGCTPARLRLAEEFARAKVLLDTKADALGVLEARVMDAVRRESIGCDDRATARVGK
jgi:hypothetical protein